VPLCATCSLLVVSLMAALVASTPAQGQGNQFDVVINEIMYHPPDSADREFIELYNSGPTLVDITNWCFFLGIDYCFGPGINMLPGEIIVLARDAVQFQAKYGFAPFDVYGGSLANEGELIALRNAVGTVIDQVAYLDQDPWPILADGLGSSLQLIDPTEDHNDPRNWRATSPATNSILLSDFELGLGAWSQVGGDDFDWTRDSGGTPTSGTGPVVDHTTSSTSGFYLYTEASGSNHPNKIALLDSVCLDLGNLTTAVLAFWYHMDGANMGTLGVQVDPGCTGSFTPVFSISGDQSNLWLQQVIDLAPYAGGTLAIRFEGTTGAESSSDMAIDDVQVAGTPELHTVGSVNSVAAVGLPPGISNVAHGSLTAGVNTDVTATVLDATQVDLIYRVDFGSEVSVPMLDDGLSGDGAAGDGVYGASVPGHAINTLVRYRLEASGPNGSMSSPRVDDTIVYHGYMVPDPALTSAIPIFHWFIEPTDYANAIAHKFSDKTEPASLVYNGQYYDALEVRVRGQTARNFPKKHWKFIFPQGHDFSAPGIITAAVDQFNLQANWADKAHVREIISYEMFDLEGSRSLETSPVRIHQNGAFYGLYTYIEQAEGSWMERVGLDRDGARYKAFSDCRVLPTSAYPGKYEKKTRLNETHADLQSLIDNLNTLTGQAARDYIFDNVSLPEQIAYLASTVIIHNNDHPAKNYYIYRDTEGTQRWWMQPWDMDLTFGRNYNGGVLNDQIWANIDVIPGRINVSPSHPEFGNRFHQKYDLVWNRCIDALYQHPEVLEMFYRHLRTQMDDILAGTHFEDRIDVLVSLQAPEHALDVGVWGQYGAAQTITQAADLLKASYLSARRTHLFNTHRVPGQIPDAQSAMPPIVITEIMYNPIGGSDFEFVEVYNPSLVESVDMSGWLVEGIDLMVPWGTVVLPDAHALLVSNDMQFRSRYGGGHFVPSEYIGKLDNAGESIVIRDRLAVEIDRVDYGVGALWPTTPNGGGPSLELIDPTLDNNDPFNWAASRGANGTPGGTNSVSLPGTPPEVRINEVIAENATGIQDEMGEFEPWIEFYNASASTVEASTWYLSDDVGNPTMWQLPAATSICSGCFLVLWADGEPLDGPFHANFALNPAGGTVYLFDSAAALVDSLPYAQSGPNGPDVSEGRLPDGAHIYRTFVVPTPASPNLPDPGPVILNEYNAVGPTAFLKGGASDVFWGQVAGNGGDWFELVVVEDHIDMRGWKLVMTDHTGSALEDTDTLLLTNDLIWSDLRQGTIITISEELPDDVSYDPFGGDWWINVRANAIGTGLYISAENFSLSNKQWQLTILDSVDQVVYGRAGEGIHPISGVGNDEVFKLEEHPSPLITPFSNYSDGSSSTFGFPNIWSAGTLVQSFASLRGCSDDPECDDGAYCNGTETCVASLCVSGTPPVLDDGVACTSDACDEVNNFVVNVPNNALCDDQQFCNGAETCDPALDCQAGVAPSVDDSVACTDDSCDEVNDVVVNAPNNALCDDPEFCDGAETCDSILDCQPGVAPSVDDGVACTDDSCDEVNDVAVNVPNNALCDDGNSCTADSCDSVTGCGHSQIPDCADGVPASSDWSIALLGLMFVMSGALLLAGRKLRANR
jgi:hypothetical protein